MSKKSRNARQERALAKRVPMPPIDLDRRLVEPRDGTYHPPSKREWHYDRRRRNLQREENERRDDAA